MRELFAISPQTMAAFSEASVKRYEDKMVVHVQKLFEDKYRELGDPLVRRLIRHGIARSAHHGFMLGDVVARYIDMMFAYGPDFDADPAHPWASRILGDATLRDPAEKMARLYAAAIDHLHLARGVRRDQAEAAGAP